MKDKITYENFDLLIERAPRGQYQARVLGSPEGESAPVRFARPFSPVELENLVLRVDLSRRGTRGPGRPESAPLKDFGGKLYNAVFKDEVRDILLRSLGKTHESRVGLRLRLRLTDTPRLAELPWELLYDPQHNRFLAQSRYTPLVRYLELPDPLHPLSMELPLRLLVMIATPSGYPALDVEREWGALTGALGQQCAAGQVIIERLAANMSTLRTLLRRAEFHVFHFIGHGRYRPDWGDGVLIMEDSVGEPLEVPGDELGSLLNESAWTRLAVLNACEGARTGTIDPFAGVAQNLIQQGLPAVVAMQFGITDGAAIAFSRELYSTIADGYPLEMALAEARGAIRDEGYLTEWATPVLYSRAPDGYLFDLTGRDQMAQSEGRAERKADHKPRESAEGRAQMDAKRKSAGHASPERADSTPTSRRTERRAGKSDDGRITGNQMESTWPRLPSIAGVPGTASDLFNLLRHVSDPEVFGAFLPGVFRPDEVLLTAAETGPSTVPRDLGIGREQAPPFVPLSSGVLVVTDSRLVFAGRAASQETSPSVSLSSRRQKPEPIFTYAIPYDLIDQATIRTERTGPSRIIILRPEDLPMILMLLLKRGDTIEFSFRKRYADEILAIIRDHLPSRFE